MEYRLVHKSDGTYILQVKERIQCVDYEKNEVKTKEVWKDQETIERG